MRLRYYPLASLLFLLPLLAGVGSAQIQIQVDGQILPAIPLPGGAVPIAVEETDEEDDEEDKDKDDKDKEKEEESPFNNPIYETLCPTERLVIRRFEQAQRLFDTNRAAEAIQLFGNLLETTQDTFIIPEKSTGKSGEKLQRTLNQTMSGQIWEMLRTAPKEVLQSYALQYEAIAKRLLENAAAAGSIQEVGAVARKYFATESGATAAFLVGTEQVDRGNYAAAFLIFDKLKRFHPALPKSIAAAVAETHTRLQTLLDQQKKGTQKPSPVSEADWLDWAGWRMPTGSPDHNPNTKASLPLIEECWDVPLFSQFQYEREAELQMRYVRRNSELFIPAAQPVIVGNRLITKSFSEILAVDIDTGKRLWAVPGASEFRVPDGVASMQQDQQPAAAIRLFGWHNRIAQQLSSDGERFYSVEDHSLTVIQSFQRGDPNRPIPDKRFSPGNTLTARDVKTGQVVWQIGKYPYVQKWFDLADAENQKDKRSLEEKQRAWNNRMMNKGNPDDSFPVDETLFTSDELAYQYTWFLGAPLPLHNRLYIIGENETAVQLFVLDAATGKLIARLPLAQSQTPAFSARNPGENAVGIGRRSYPLFPAASEGILLCPTGSGLIIAVDAMTVEPLWGFTYLPEPDKNENEKDNQNMRRMRRTIGIHSNMVLTDSLINQIYADRGWQVPTITVDQQKVLIAPVDRASLYCLDLLTGKLLWEKDKAILLKDKQGNPQKEPNTGLDMFSKNDAIYVACVHKDKVFTVGRTQLTAHQLDTGAEVRFDKFPLGVKFPSGLLPAGTGIHCDNQYIFPFSGGYLGIVNLDTGEFTWLDAEGTTNMPNVSDEDRISASAEGGSNEYYGNMMLIRGAGRIVSPEFYSNQSNGMAVFTPDLVTAGIFPKALQYGNLVGVKGKIFSQSPVRVAAYEQREALRTNVENTLKKDAANADALFGLAKIRKAEGKRTEAGDLLRKSLAKKQIPEAAELLKDLLLDNLRYHYAENPNLGKEIETLPLFPEDLGNVLYAQIEGMLHSRQTGDLNRILEKVFATTDSPPMLVTVDKTHSAQLYRAVGSLLNKYWKEQGDPQLKAAWEQTAKDFFTKFSEGYAAAPPDSAAAEGFVAQWDKNAVRVSPDINKWQAFAEIFCNTEIVGEVKKRLTTLYRQAGIHCSLENADTPVTTAAPLVSTWKQGRVNLVDDSPEDAAKAKEEPAASQAQDMKNADDNTKFVLQHINTKIHRVFPNIMGHTDAAVTRGTMQSSRNVPLLEQRGTARQVYQYAFEMVQAQGNTATLSCYDASGERQWRIPLPFRNPNPNDYNRYNNYAAPQVYRGFYDQPIYLKGVGNLLVLVWDDMLAAIDTTMDNQTAPKVLWTKRLDTTLPSRLNGSAVSPLTGSFPNSGVYVSKSIVCCRDTQYIYGLDPMTGQTLWVRKNQQDLCSIFGDHENLFLVFPETRQAAAVDPASGTWLAGASIPQGGFYACGTNLLFAKGDPNKEAKIVIMSCDLRDLYDKRRRALLVTDVPQDGITSLPIKVIQSGLDPSSIVQMINDDQYLAVLNWDKKSLQIYNPATKEPLLENPIALSLEPKEVNHVNTVNGNIMIVNGMAMPYGGGNVSMPMNVEIIDGNILVTVVKSQPFQYQQEQIKDSSGVVFNRHFQPISGLATVPIGDGTMMMYDKKGKPCWNKPAEIKNWFQMVNVPNNLPVNLYAVTVMDSEVLSGKQHQMTGLMGIDKRTGQIRFRKLISPPENNNGGYYPPPLQGCRVAADPQRQEISFFVPQTNRTIRAIFTDEPIPMESDAAKRSTSYKGEPAKLQPNDPRELPRRDPKQQPVRRVPMPMELMSTVPTVLL